MHASIKGMKEDIGLSKSMVVNKGATMTPIGSIKVNILRPSRFNGYEMSKKIKNFIWELD